MSRVRDVPGFGGACGSRGLRRSCARGEDGQAVVELLGALPAVLIVGLVLFQLLAVGYSSVLAGNAAEAGALALAGGHGVKDAARKALPGWTRARARVAVRGGRVRVTLRPPSPIRGLGRRLRVSAEASVEVGG